MGVKTRTNTAKEQSDDGPGPPGGNTDAPPGPLDSAAVDPAAATATTNQTGDEDETPANGAGEPSSSSSAPSTAPPPTTAPPTTAQTSTTPPATAQGTTTNATNSTNDRKRFDIIKVAFGDPRKAQVPAKPAEEDVKPPIPPLITVPFRKGKDTAAFNYNADLFSSIKKALDSRVTAGDYITEHRPHDIKIHTTSEAVHELVRSALKNNNINAFTQPLHTTAPKMKRFVILDLSNPDLDQLLEELERYGLYPLDLKIMTIRRPKFPGHTNVLVYFDEEDHITLEVVSKALYLCHNKVTWEHYRQAAPRQRQCENCLAPGHSALYCDMPARCYYCASHNHTAPDCPLRAMKEKLGAKAIPPRFLKCANCNGNHTAISIDCPAKKRYADYLQQKMQPNRPQAQSAPPIRPGPIQRGKPQPAAHDPWLDLGVPANERVYKPAPTPATNPWLPAPPPTSASWADADLPVNPPAHTPTEQDYPEWSVVQNKKKRPRNQQQPKAPQSASQPSSDANSNITISNNRNSNTNLPVSNILSPSAVNYNSNSDSSLFTTQQLSSIFQEMVAKLRTCTNKGDQLTALMDIALKYTPCQD